jgi:hypothetical protein
MADQTIAKQRELLEGQRQLEQEHERAREFYVLILTGIEKLSFVQQLLMCMTYQTKVRVIPSND